MHGARRDGFDVTRVLLALVGLAFVSTVAGGVLLLATGDPSSVSFIGRAWLTVFAVLTPLCYRRYMDGFVATVTDWLVLVGASDAERDRDAPSLVVHSLALPVLLAGTVGVFFFVEWGGEYGSDVSVAIALGMDRLFGLGFWAYLGLFGVGWFLVAVAWVVEGLAIGD